MRSFPRQLNSGDRSIGPRRVGAIMRNPRARDGGVRRGGSAFPPGTAELAKLGASPIRSHSATPAGFCATSASGPPRTGSPRDARCGSALRRARRLEHHDGGRSVSPTGALDETGAAARPVIPPPMTTTGATSHAELRAPATTPSAQRSSALSDGTSLSVSPPLALKLSARGCRAPRSSRGNPPRRPS